MRLITVQELKDKKEKGDTFFLLDVRDYHEYLVSNLNGHHIPYNSLQSRLNELDEYKEKEIIVMCRSGSTSRDACKLLIRSGFKNVLSLDGGMKRWAKEIDPSIPVV